MNICTIINCGNEAKGRGLCNKHYLRFRIHGDANKTIINMNPPEKCTIIGCNKSHEAKGLCHSHYMIEYLRERRKLVINHYTNGTMKCACCGESIFEFLTIDHLNNDGAKHRSKISNRRRSGNILIEWLIKNNFPEGLGVACFNCNCGRGFNGGICPHKKNI